MSIAVENPVGFKLTVLTKLTARCFANRRATINTKSLIKVSNYFFLLSFVSVLSVTVIVVGNVIDNLSSIPG